MFDTYRQRVCPKRIRRAINAYRYHKPRISLEAGTGQERAATALARDDLQQGPYCGTNHLQGHGKKLAEQDVKQDRRDRGEANDMDDKIKIESELLLARMRDRQQRRQDDLEALLAQVDLFKALDTPYGHNLPSA